MVREGVRDGHGWSGSIGFPGFRPISGDSCNECSHCQHEVRNGKFSHVAPFRKRPVIPHAQPKKVLNVNPSLQTSPTSHCHSSIIPETGKVKAG